MNPEETVVYEPLAVGKRTAGRMLDISYSTVYKLCKEGKLETIRIGADERVLVSSIRKLAKEAT
jgi:hypothetical protein